MTEKIVVEKAELVEFDEAELDSQPFGTFDDNGGYPDGNMYLLPLAEVDPFEGMKIVSGFVVHGYSGPANYHDYCGFSSRDVAYTTNRETAEAIALDEYGIHAAE